MTLTEPITDRSSGVADDAVAHLVLQDEWPVALCGYTVKERVTNKAIGRDRCAACLKIAADRQLGRPGWL